MINIEPTAVENLQIENTLLKQENAELKAKVNRFEEQFRLSKQREFGRSSEKSAPEQLGIFNEVEVEARPDAPEQATIEINYTRRKAKETKEEKLKNVPLETIEYRLPEEEQVCSCCGGPLHEMSTEERIEIEYAPPKISGIKHIRYIYSCRNCEKNEISTPIKTAPAPKPVLSGSIASPSMIACVMSQKFVMGLPLYRQEQDFERQGISISRQTMANWMIQASDRWLKQIYERMREHLLAKDILHADETTLQVLHEPGRKAESTSYMWLYRTGRDGPPIILYDYQTSRSGKHPSGFLKEFKGYLHTDGYGGYNDLPNIIHVGCWAHARRKFDEALKALPTSQKNTPTVAGEGLDFCNKLFAIERELAEVTPDERHKKRIEHSRPVLDAFRDWLKYQTPRVLPKSALGQAIRYCRNQWDKLEGFMKDGRLEIDNNRSERSIKPFVIGRKNWLFANTAKGATSSAVIYSVVETAKENGLNPFEYLKFLFEKMPNMDLDDKQAFDEILPWSKTLPEVCKAKN
ncbi:MAG: IS66 family transposase [Bacteroidota bacterium]